jgi:signal transduction histidine kinase
MENLLSNAIKFAPVDSVITVTLEVNAAYLQVSVHNQGPSIPPEAQTTIFGK